MAARPRPRCSSSSMTRRIAFDFESPSRGPEFTSRPSPARAMPVDAGSTDRQVLGEDRVALLVELDHRDDAGHGRVRVDDDAHGQLEGAREVEVALVVRGHGHDRAVAVVGEHVVGGPDRHALAVHGVHGVALEEDARLRALGRQAIDVALAAHGVEVVLEPGPHLGGCPGRELGGELGVGRDDHERRAVERVGSRREDRDPARRGPRSRTRRRRPTSGRSSCAAS